MEWWACWTAAPRLLQLRFRGSAGQVAKSLDFSKEPRNLNFCAQYPFKS